MLEGLGGLSLVHFVLTRWKQSITCLSLALICRNFGLVLMCIIHFLFVCLCYRLVIFENLGVL
jgi:cell division protein FtsW (lipid II flippase)